MKLSEALKYYEEGKKIRCSFWEEDAYIQKDEDDDIDTICIKSFRSNDWEVVEKLVDFMTMIQHLKNGGKARKKSWKNNNEDRYWYITNIEGCDLIYSSDGCSVQMNLSRIEAKDYILC